MSKPFAKLLADKFSFYSIDIHSVGDLPPTEQDSIQQLKKENEISETPTLLFLDPVNLETKLVSGGFKTLEPALVVSKLASQLPR